MSVAPERKLPVLPATGGCRACVLYRYKACYGLTGFDAEQGCGVRCGPNCAEKGDWTCIHRQDLAERFREVGFPLSLAKALRTPTERPKNLYVPGVHHGKRRGEVLERPWVMLPLHKVVPMRQGPPATLVSDRAGLEREFMIAPSTKVIVVGVAQDDYLEWLARSGGRGVGKMLASLGVEAVTAPNFSLFPDAPQMHTIWNRLRVLKVCERWSDEGAPVVPHINIHDEHDLLWWRDYLRRHPEIDCIAREFVTGNASRKAARHALADVKWLEEQVGRPLHLYAIGAKRRAADIKGCLASWTLIDSKPFMAAMHREVREVINGRLQWVSKHTPKGEPLDNHLEVNIRQYDKEVAAVTGRPFRSSHQCLLRLWPSER